MTWLHFIVVSHDYMYMYLLLQRLLDEKFIAHVSGNRKIQFVDGCYMYCKMQGGCGFGHVTVT